MKAQLLYKREGVELKYKIDDKKLRYFVSVQSLSSFYNKSM